MRSLPIRVAPAHGEALDSWLEAIASKNRTEFGQILRAVGLPTHHTAGEDLSWIVQLTTQQCDSLTAATGYGRSLLASMTLSTYIGHALHANTHTGRISNGFLFGQAHRSRFCPNCLADSSGRWPLKWRLQWTFACTAHRCLLVDACTQCGATQRSRRYPERIVPQPGRCKGRAPGEHTHQRCRGDLTTMTGKVFPAEHAAIKAQQIIDELIAQKLATFGVYTNQPQPATNALADIRTLAFSALRHGTSDFLQRHVPTDLLDHFRSCDGARSSSSSAARSCLNEPVTAVTVAVGIVAAFAVLNHPEIASAAKSLSQLTSTAADTDHKLHPRKLQCGFHTTRVLAAIRQAAIKPVPTPVDQIRSRIGSSPTPARAQTRTLRGAELLSCALPTVLWPVWCLPLATPRNLLRQLRAALSVTLQIVNSPIDLSKACHLIDSPLTEPAVIRVIGLLAAQPQWCDIRHALYRMSDYLRDNPPPINYRRRRALDYAPLLPDDVWTRICRDIGYESAGAPRAKAVRRFLFERLSGMPADMAPYAAKTTHPVRATIEFPGWLTTELLDALYDHALRFLHAQNVNDEPPSWEPPATLLSDLDLPGLNPHELDPAPLKQIPAGPTRIGRVTNELAISIDAARYLVEKHPALPPEWVSGATQRPWHEGSYRVAKTLLPPKRLADLYIRQRISLTAIAASVDVRPDIVVGLAEEYGLRPAKSATTQNIEPDWLLDQFVFEQRRTADIASDAGVSTRTVAERAKKFGIPPKGRRDRCRQPSIDPKTLSRSIPKLLWPALTTAGGWTRLRRFAAATQYPSLRAAAHGLDIHSTALGKQIAQIEHELGAQLLVRAAPGGYPMALTAAGEKVVRAVAQAESKRSTRLWAITEDTKHHKGSQNGDGATPHGTGRHPAARDSWKGVG
jgi:hypothetical protein